MLAEILGEIHDNLEPDHSGRVAGYIPVLAQVDPDQFGLALSLPNGEIFTSGDVDAPFTIQSACKPFLLATALDLMGEDVFEVVGAEPSGDAFDAIKLPASNPMVNAGAIAVSGLLERAYGETGKDEVNRAMSLFAGRELVVNTEVMESELATADRNRAIAHLLAGENYIGNVDRTLELYIYACALEVDAVTLATMACTLATGTNPQTDEPVLEHTTARRVLSIALTCGMYDYAGRWAVEVGLPAKSAVSGGVMAAVPGRAGVGIFSPRLDERGNSVRAVKACTELGHELGLHVLDPEGSRLLNAYLA